MEKDLVIYNKETKQIIAILTNYSAEDIVCRNDMEYKVVNPNERYITGNEITGELYILEQKDNIRYIKDYIQDNRRDNNE